MDNKLIDQEFKSNSTNFLILVGRLSFRLGLLNPCNFSNHIKHALLSLHNFYLLNQLKLWKRYSSSAFY